MRIEPQLGLLAVAVLICTVMSIAHRRKGADLTFLDFSDGSRIITKRHFIAKVGSMHDSVKNISVDSPSPDVQMLLLLPYEFGLVGGDRYATGKYLLLRSEHNGNPWNVPQIRKLEPLGDASRKQPSADAIFHLASRSRSRVAYGNPYCPLCELVILDGDIRAEPGIRGKIHEGTLSINERTPCRVSSTISRVSRLIVGIVHADCKRGVDSEKQYTQYPDPVLKFVPLGFLCFASNFIMGFGWWRGRNARSDRRVWIGLLCLFIGFVSSVWSLIVLVNRIGI